MVRMGPRQSRDGAGPRRIALRLRAAAPPPRAGPSRAVPHTHPRAAPTCPQRCAPGPALSVRSVCSLRIPRPARDRGAPYARGRAGPCAVPPPIRDIPPPSLRPALPCPPVPTCPAPRFVPPAPIPARSSARAPGIAPRPRSRVGSAPAPQPRPQRREEEEGGGRREEGGRRTPPAGSGRTEPIHPRVEFLLFCKGKPRAHGKQRGFHAAARAAGPGTKGAGEVLRVLPGAAGRAVGLCLHPAMHGAHQPPAPPPSLPRGCSTHRSSGRCVGSAVPVTPAQSRAVVGTRRRWHTAEVLPSIGVHRGSKMEIPRVSGKGPISVGPARGCSRAHQSSQAASKAQHLGSHVGWALLGSGLRCPLRAGCGLPALLHPAQLPVVLLPRPVWPCTPVFLEQLLPLPQHSSRTSFCATGVLSWLLCCHGNGDGNSAPGILGLAAGAWELGGNEGHVRLDISSWVLGSNEGWVGLDIRKGSGWILGKISSPNSGWMLAQLPRGWGGHCPWGCSRTVGM